MNSIGLIISVLMLAGMFIFLRRIERWLHQHIFKVGWLLTQNYQTTTILYYTFFLPGVVLHEVILWLAAGVFNVRSERAIKWPEAQEVGELKLNFVQLTGRSHPYRRAIITVMPTLIGLVVIWLVANNIFDIMAVVATMSTGELTDVAAAFSQLTGAPLFWLWVYVIFCIANTMYPIATKDLRGWRTIILGVGVLLVALLVLGLGGEVFDTLSAPISQIINVLLATFVLIIGIDVLMVLVLGLIEYTIERITGNSATFRRGKMYTMTREEALEERRKQREREQRRARRQRENTEIVYNSIYQLAFTTPDAPGDVPVTQLQETATADEQPATRSLFGNAPIEETPTATDRQRDLEARINFPQRQAPPPPETPAATIAQDTQDDTSAEAEAAVEIARQSAKPRQQSLRLDSQTDKNETQRDQDNARTQQRPIKPAAAAQPQRPASQADERSAATKAEKADDDGQSKRASRLEQLRRDGQQLEKREVDKPPTSAQETPTVDAPAQEKDDAEKTTPSTPALARFQPRKPDISQEKRSDSSPFKRPNDSDESSTPSKPAATQKSTTAQLGIRPFNEKDADQEDDKPKPTAASKPPTSRFGIRPFDDQRGDDDAETGDDEQSAIRRARARDATSDLFKGISPTSQADTPEEDDDLEDDTPPANVSGLGTPRSFTRSSSTISRRRSSQPFARASFDDDEDDDFDEDDEAIDDIVYEDFEDDLIYEDDDEYTDYVGDDD